MRQLRNAWLPYRGRGLPVVELHAEGVTTVYKSKIYVPAFVQHIVAMLPADRVPRSPLLSPPALAELIPPAAPLDDKSHSKARRHDVEDIVAEEIDEPFETAPVRGPKASTGGGRERLERAPQSTSQSPRKTSRPC
jgi:hypothetical protein